MSAPITPVEPTKDMKMDEVSHILEVVLDPAASIGTKVTMSAELLRRPHVVVALGSCESAIAAAEADVVDGKEVPFFRTAQALQEFKALVTYARELYHAATFDTFERLIASPPSCLENAKVKARFQRHCETGTLLVSACARVRAAELVRGQSRGDADAAREGGGSHPYGVLFLD